ncbi:MAG: hypothetical protein NTX49_02535 [Chlamydiae bacterium]|nr:hypothetical protein [Chlamydiota bacterium]
MSIRNFAATLALATLTTALSFSLYNGNPSSPELPEDGFLIPKECWLGIKAGYQGDYVFSRSMIVHASDSSASHQINSFSSYMNSGTLTFDFANRAEFYGVLGSYKLKLSQRLDESTRVHFSSDPHIAGIIGLRAILATWGDTHLGADVKGFISYPEIESIEVNGSSVSSGSAKFSDREWQIGTSLSHQVFCFVPYIGLTYTHARLKATKLASLKSYFPKEELRLNNKYSFGFVFGFGLTADTGFSCNLEARIIQEAAATLSADFRF